MTAAAVRSASERRGYSGAVSTPNGEVAPARILLVDDRPENLLALEAILSSLGQTLVRARSGEEALKALLADDYAVILLDVQMPGMDGFETAAHIKRRERTRDIPIIFLTAISREPQHAFRGYSAGAVDYLAKPFDPWVLRAKVAVFVELYRKNRQLREQAELLAAQVAGLGDPEVVEDVARHLDAVEAHLEMLRGESAAVATSAVEGLTASVAALRARLDSLRPS